MIVFLADFVVVQRCLRQVLAMVPVAASVAAFPVSVPAECRRAFAVGGGSHKVVLDLLAKGTEVIDVTDCIWRAFALAASPGSVLGLRNLTLSAAARELHDAARSMNPSPEGLRALIARTVRPLVQLGYLHEPVKVVLDEWARCAAWTGKEWTRVASLLRSQSLELRKLSAINGDPV